MREALVPPGAVFGRLHLIWQMTERDWIERQARQARLELERAKEMVRHNRYAKQELTSAANHALWAWTRAHSTRRVSNNQKNHEVFLDEAPTELVKLHNEAFSAITRLSYDVVSPGTVVETVDRMIEAIFRSIDHKD